MNVLVMVLGTIGCGIHENVQSISDSSKNYFIVESDGTKITLSKERYMLVIMR